jgi:predicted amidohydrolase
VRVGFYQFTPTFGEVQTNLNRITAALWTVVADVIVLPELATSGYLFLTQEEIQAVAEPVPGPTTDRLQRLAQKSGSCFVVGLAERSGDDIYNSAVLVGATGVMGTYRKAHLFYEEKHFFRPGNLGFPLFEVAGAKVGLLVCFDHLYPEAARTLALGGAQIICHPSNLVLPGVAQLTTRVRALENRVFWVLGNRTGTEERGGKTLTFTGRSQIVAPNGTLLAEAPADGESVSIVEIDVAEASDKHLTPLNDLFADRRSEFYQL